MEYNHITFIDAKNVENGFWTKFENKKLQN